MRRGHRGCIAEMAAHHSFPVIAADPLLISFLAHLPIVFASFISRSSDLGPIHSCRQELKLGRGHESDVRIADARKMLVSRGSTGPIQNGHRILGLELSSHSTLGFLNFSV